MKFRKFLAGLMACAMALTGIPSLGVDGVGLQQAPAANIAGSGGGITAEGNHYRYATVSLPTVTVDWGELETGTAADNMKLDDATIALTKERAAGPFTSNNNIYLTLSKAELLGRLSYLSGHELGSIKRANIYVSNCTLADDETPANIHESGWLKVWDNVDAGDAPWTAYGEGGTDRGEAYFDTLQYAKYVRIEVKETVNAEKSGKKDEMKWISGRRFLVYEADPMDQEWADTNVAFKKKIKAYTGFAPPNAIPTDDNKTEYLNDGTAQDSPQQVWAGGVVTKNAAGTGYDAAKKNYIVMDFKNIKTDISGIKVQWNKLAFGTKYYIETSDTCRLEGPVANGAETGDTWEKVAEHTADNSKTSSPLHTLTLTKTQVKRYVRLRIETSNTNAGIHYAAVQELTITGTALREMQAVNIAEGKDINGFTTKVQAYTGSGASTGTPDKVIDGEGIKEIVDLNDQSKYVGPGYNWGTGTDPLKK